MLDKAETALNFAKTMAWKRKQLLVRLVPGTHKTGVKLTKEAMVVCEKMMVFFTLYFLSSERL